VETIEARIVVKPVQIALPERVLNRLARNEACKQGGACVVFYTVGANEAIMVSKPCPTCVMSVQQLVRDPKKPEWYGDYDRPVDLVVPGRPPQVDTNTLDLSALKAGKAEIRPVTRRQVFVDGKPVGTPFE